jgi:hypothetical protein
VNLLPDNSYVRQTAYKYGAIGFALGLIATWIF